MGEVIKESNKELSHLIKEIENKKINLGPNYLADHLWDMAEEAILPMIISKTSLFIEVKISGEIVRCLLDTGAEDNVIDYALAKKLNLLDYIDENHASIVSGVGHSITFGRIPYVEIEIEGDNYPLCFTVMELGCKKDTPILGLPFMCFYKTIIDMSKRTLNIMGKNKKLLMYEH